MFHRYVVLFGMVPIHKLRKAGIIESLIILSENGGQTEGNVAEAVDLHSSTIRKRMLELQDEGLVEVEADIVDGRAVKVWTVTDVGEGVAQQLGDIVSDFDSNILVDAGETATAESDD